MLFFSIYTYSKMLIYWHKLSYVKDYAKDAASESSLD